MQKKMQRYLLIILGIIIIGVSYSENITSSWTDTQNIFVPWQTKIIQPDLSINNTLEKVKLRFCNELKENNVTTELLIQMRPWQKKEICMLFLNNGDTTWDILRWFTDATINEKWLMVCGIDTPSDFIRHIQKNKTWSISIPPHNQLIQRTEYHASKNESGNIYACVSFRIDQEDQTTPGSPFKIIARKIGNIKIQLSWSTYVFWRWDDFKETIIKNPIILKITIGILWMWLIVVVFGSSKKWTNRKDQAKSRK